MISATAKFSIDLKFEGQPFNVTVQMTLPEYREILGTGLYKNVAVEELHITSFTSEEENEVSTLVYSIKAAKSGNTPWRME